MKLPHAIALFFIIIISGSCETKKQEETQKQPVVIETVTPRPIDMYLYAGFPAELAKTWQQRIAQYNPEVRVMPAMDLPESALYKPKNRYMALGLLAHVKSLSPKGRLAIGLTHHDICQKRPDNPCFGIMGISYLPSDAVIISTHRLKQRKLTEQGFKLCMHELGHAEGLDHCNDLNCLMRDARGRNIFDEVEWYCASCAGHLRNKGWKM
jgi:archaemetzincin